VVHVDRRLVARVMRQIPSTDHEVSHRHTVAKPVAARPPPPGTSWLTMMRRVEEETSLLGASSHLLTIATR
jgi:hypothetical protein